MQIRVRLSLNRTLDEFPFAPTSTVAGRPTLVFRLGAPDAPFLSILMTRAELAVDDPVGEPRPVRVPGSVGRALQELRTEMYEPGRGTWFSLRYSIDPPMEYPVLFNYDDDPNWWPPIPVKAWASDLQTYPRDPEYVSGWLREKLAEWNQQEE